MVQQATIAEGEQADNPRDLGAQSAICAQPQNESFPRAAGLGNHLHYLQSEPPELHCPTLLHPLHLINYVTAACPQPFLLLTTAIGVAFTLRSQDVRATIDPTALLPRSELQRHACRRRSVCSQGIPFCNHLLLILLLPHFLTWKLNCSTLLRHYGPSPKIGKVQQNIQKAQKLCERFVASHPEPRMKRTVLHT